MQRVAVVPHLTKREVEVAHDVAQQRAVFKAKKVDALVPIVVKQAPSLDTVLGHEWAVVLVGLIHLVIPRLQQEAHDVGGAVRRDVDVDVRHSWAGLRGCGCGTTTGRAACACWRRARLTFPPFRVERASCASRARWTDRRRDVGIAGHLGISAAPPVPPVGKGAVPREGTGYGGLICGDARVCACVCDGEGCRKTAAAAGRVRRRRGRGAECRI